ncbi:MAG: DUF2141 domain-containing protein [Planctomycetota bacterium]|nr:DUF2141 domain-containing protein [Planctomycetota bacterium]
MIRISSLLFGLLIGALGSGVVAQDESTPPTPTSGDLLVPIENLQNIGQGQLLVLLFRRVDRIEPKVSWAFRTRIVAVRSRRMIVTFKNVPFGEYAVSVLHDMDRDREMDTNFFGIPDEDLGCSNNAKGGVFGGPKWDKAKFSHKRPQNKIAPIEMWQCYD